MKGCTTIPLTATRVTVLALLVLCAWSETVLADPTPVGRPGQRGEGGTGGVVNFAELAAAEGQSASAASGVRAIRPRSKPSPGRRPTVPGARGVARQRDRDQQCTGRTARIGNGARHPSMRKGVVEDSRIVDITRAPKCRQRNRADGST